MKTKRLCHDCGAEEGQIHELGCDMECCPYCGGQLISCGCPGQYMTLEALNEKGRIPYIEYPNVCAKCGKLWPELFMVSNKKWRYYIQINMQDKVICRECYNKIRELIDTKGTPHKR